MITGALPYLAGLTHGHDVCLVDENVEEIPWEKLESFDIVGVTGMNVQKERMRQILEKLRPMNVLTVVGGAYASVDEGFFDGLCDVLFSGEADDTWPEFVSCIAEGRNHDILYKQRNPTDMTKVPKPRFDLLKVDRYASGALQFSRGCPFQCEFCDIIVTFGRRPRTKNPQQVVEELDEMRRVGFFSCFIVDDNFIGNKKAAKELLRLIIPWQQKNGYPLRLTTEASVNLADDPELLELLYQANFRSVFIGIETPRVASLNETKKFQNMRGDSLEAKLARIRNAGMEVSAGFIVGFDNDDTTIFEEQFRFIQENGILLAMVGMLAAVPKTPLYERLEKEGRLKLDDPNCNIVPKQMTSSELQRNYWELLKRLYDPQAFFDRYFTINEYPDFKRRRAEISKRAHEGKALPTLLYGLLLLQSLVRALIRDRSLMTIGVVYLRNFFQRSLRVRADIIGFA
ncbi:MAG: radical SAM protein, partial [Candidatus Binatia bacterium]